MHAGSDVVEAFTYYGHREKLRLIGKEDLLEPLNRDALAHRREVARETGTLLAGDVCNTNVSSSDDARAARRARDVRRAGRVGGRGGRRLRDRRDVPVRPARRCSRTEAIRAAGLDAVVTLAIHRDPVTREGWTPAEACRRLADAGAAVVGLNCIRGPRTMLPLLARVRAAVDVPVAALPVPYRTHDAEPTFQSLATGGATRAFPVALDPFTCTRYEVADFARDALALGVEYLGLCCGAAPHHIRAMAEAMGRRPPASRYSPDMSKHAYLGTDPSLQRGEPRLRGAAVARVPLRRHRRRRASGAPPPTGSAAAPGDEVLCLEQWELGHGQGASEDHSRIIRLGYHSPPTRR